MEKKEIIKASKISQINLSTLSIGIKKNNEKIPIFIDNNNLIFQTPFLECLSSFKKTNYPNFYHLDTLLKGDHKNKINELYNFIDELENTIILKISNLIKLDNNVKSWFTSNNIDIKSLIKENEINKQIYIKWLIEIKEDLIITDKKEKYNFELLKEKDLIKLIVEVSEMWIHENQIGIIYKIHKILIKPYTEIKNFEYQFNESSEEENKQKENELISLLATEQKSKKKNIYIENKNLKKDNNTKNQLNIIPIENIKKQKKNKNNVIDVIDDKIDDLDF